MKNKKIVILTFLACISLHGFAQESNSNITGIVLDKWGHPVYGASVSTVSNPQNRVETNKAGKFKINASKNQKLQILSSDKGLKTVEVETDKPMTIVLGYSAQAVNVGYNMPQSIEESTASVSTIFNEEFNKRGAKDISNSLFGLGLGLTTLQNAGNYAAYEPTFYVRGLQTLSSNTPLTLVDGIERDLSNISPEEVETVNILKDAAAVALYGYKGINGVINVVTKRGKYNTKEVKFSYDHVINREARRPKFTDSYTYANAVNEALTNDGQSTRYSADELSAFKSGQYPYLYPNVDWIKNTFKNTGASNIYNVSFRGGGSKFRYYTLLDLTNNDGFIANANVNSGYSTQNKYSKGNMRTNLDIDLTDKTKLVLNILGSLTESSRPGASVNLWSKIDSIPSAAFPIKTKDGIWGGNANWDGTDNPVALSQAASYSKGHIRTFFTDMTLKQDLSAVLPGLGANVQVAYDNAASYWEDHSKTYVYGSDAVTAWSNGAPTTTQHYTGGTESGMGTTSSLSTWTRKFNFFGSLDYNRILGAHKVYSQLKWDYEYRNVMGLNNTWYRQNLSSYTHYGFNDRYFADLTLVASASNKLAPEHRWAFSPTVSAAWVLSKENFMKNISFIDFLKLRASWGIINADNLPLDKDQNSVEDYWEQVYSGGSLYNFDTGYSSSLGSWTLGQLASLNSTHEKANKYNIGIDATLFKGLDITVDGYYQRRSDIWVASSGVYSSLLGFTAPYENAGVVDSWGIEVGADYHKKVGDFTLNLGGNFTLAKNKIINQLEEPRIFSNLVQTGNPLKQTYGLQAIGFFKDQADIDNSPVQNFSTVKPGDIKYKDVNKDSKIDENDKIAIGYSTTAPEVYYSFHLGTEWEGLGFSAMFQGTGRYSAVLNTQSIYWPLINNTTISQNYYDNRWTADNQNAKYPRLTSQSNKNNFQTNTVWLEDRSFLKLRQVEVYYNFPQALLKRVKIMDNAKLYVRGVDLLCFDHIKVSDPEAYGATNPLTRSVVAGLTIGF